MRICTSTLTFCPRSCTLPPAATPIFQPRPFRLAVGSAGITFSKVPFHIPHPLCRSLSSPAQSTSNVISAEFCPCFPQNPLSILPGIPDPAACQTQLRILSRSQHLAPGPYSAFCAGTGNRLSIPSLDGALSPPPVFAQHPVPGMETLLNIPSRSGDAESLHFRLSTPPPGAEPSSLQIQLIISPKSQDLAHHPTPGQDILHSFRPRSASFLGARTLFIILTGVRASRSTARTEPAADLLPRPCNSSLLHFLYFEPIPAESRK